MHFVRGTTGTQDGLTQLGGVVLMETRLAPSSQIPMHTHENATIVLLLSGDYRETFRGESAPLAPLTVVAKPSGEEHANDVGTKGARCLVVELTDEKVRELGEVARPCAEPSIQATSPASRSGLRIVQELRRPDALSVLALEAAVMQLVVDLCRRRPRCYGHEPNWMRTCLELLHDTAPGTVRLSSLASAIGVHPIHLARTFRRIHGCSIGRYARRLQSDRAIDLLVRTAIPLGEVAVAAGFYDQSHMARAIRRDTGMTAREVRASARG